MNLKKVITQSIRENLAPGNNILSTVHGTKSAQRKVPVTRFARRAAAIAFAAVMLLSVSVFAIAGNPLKPVTLSFYTDNNIVSTGDSVDVDVKIASNLWGDFTKGIVGLTMYIDYDNAVLDYVDGSISTELDTQKFDVTAHEYEDGKIAVLIFPTASDSGKLIPAAADDGKLFSLPFTATAEGTCTFTATNETKLADYENNEEGFELVTVTLPQSLAVTVSNADVWNVTASASGGGSISPGTGTVANGANKTFTITPANNRYISEIKVNNATVNVNTLTDYATKSLNEAFTFTLNNVTADSAIEVTFKPIINMWNGASIRLTGYAALRFGTEVSKEFMTDLERLNFKTEDSTLQMGTLIIPKAMLGEQELTLDFDDILDIPRTMWQTDYFPQYTTAGYEAMTGVIKGFPEAGYTTPLAGRAYITFGATTIYSDFDSTNNVRSIREVAEKVLDSGNLAGYSPDQLTELYKYANRTQG